MYNHEPEGYTCPFCLIVQGTENEKVYTKQADIFYKDEEITGFIASHWWPNNPGHVIIIPNSHYENIYDLPTDLNHEVADFTKQVALALKETYQCPGVTIRQHNEPDGGQDVWHYHMHVLPRYPNDRLYQLVDEIKLSTPGERKLYADKLRDYFRGIDE